MGILQDILSNQQGAILNQVASQFGLDANQAQSAIGQLVPALARGVQNNSQQQGGMQALMQALQTGNHQNYVNEPSRLERPETVSDGNAILGHLFGSKEVSREVASRASKKSGVSSSILKKMLPVLATTVMGSLSKQSNSSSGPLQGFLSQAVSGGASNNNQQSSGMMNLLGGFLDADKDGSYLDDVVGMIGKRIVG